MHRSNRSILIIALVVIVALFLYFGGGLTGLTHGGGLTGGKMMGFGGAGGFGGGWMPVLIALGVGILIGWAIFRRR